MICLVLDDGRKLKHHSNFIQGLQRRKKIPLANFHQIRDATHSLAALDSHSGLVLGSEGASATYTRRKSMRFSNPQFTPRISKADGIESAQTASKMCVAVSRLSSLYERLKSHIDGARGARIYEIRLMDKHRCLLDHSFRSIGGRRCGGIRNRC